VNPNGFCALPHETMRGLAAHPGLPADTRVVLAIMSYTHAFKRDGGAARIKFRELVQRSGVRNYGVFQKIVDRLIIKGVINVEGSGRETRIYSFRQTAEQDKFHHLAEQDLTKQRSKSVPPDDGTTSFRQMASALEEEKEGPKNSQEGNEAGQPDQTDDGTWPPYQVQLRLHVLRAEKERCVREGEVFLPKLETELQDLKSATFA
jgi:hypothetical protein